MNKELKQAAFDLYMWQYAGTTSFTAMLFDLIAKADANNKAKLSRAFPVEVAIFLEWYNSESPTKFFQRYQIINEQGGPKDAN